MGTNIHLVDHHHTMFIALKRMKELDWKTPTTFALFGEISIHSPGRTRMIMNFRKQIFDYGLISYSDDGEEMFVTDLGKRCYHLVSIGCIYNTNTRSMDIDASKNNIKRIISDSKKFMKVVDGEYDPRGTEIARLPNTTIRELPLLKHAIVELEKQDETRLVKSIKDALAELKTRLTRINEFIKNFEYIDADLRGKALLKGPRVMQRTGYKGKGLKDAGHMFDDTPPTAAEQVEMEKVLKRMLEDRTVE